MREGGGLDVLDEGGEDAVGRGKGRKEEVGGKEEGGGKGKEEGVRLRIELDLDLEIQLTARIKGSITIGLLG